MDKYDWWEFINVEPEEQAPPPLAPEIIEIIGLL